MRPNAQRGDQSKSHSVAYLKVTRKADLNSSCYKKKKLHLCMMTHVN